MQHWIDGLSRVKRTLILISLGGSVVLALPPIYVWPLAFVGISGLFLFLDRAQSYKQAFVTGWLFGIGFFGGGLFWLSNALLVHPEKHGWLVPLAVPGLAVVMGLYIAVTALLARLLWRGQKQEAQVWGRYLLFVVSWVVMEWVRGWLFTGFPWNLIGTIWAFDDAMIQPAAFVGAYGLSLLTMLALTCPALVFYVPVRLRKWVFLASAVVPLLMWSFGTLRLSQAEVATHDGVVLRLVQPNITQADKWNREHKFKNFQEHVKLSLAESKSGQRPKFVIWPETAVTYSIDRDPSVRAAIAQAVPPGGAILTGAPRMTPAGHKPYQVWNSLMAINGQGKVIASYDKSHLVPFGEYIPLRGLIPFPKLTAGLVDFSAGSGPQNMKVTGLPSFGALICYEIIFPNQVVNQNRRPDWMLNVTNDGWYGNTPGPYQHLISAKMRSVEEGMAVVRVANTGVSAVMDPYGRILTHIPYGTRGVVDVALPKKLERSEWGGRLHTFVWIVLSVLILLAGQGGLYFYRKR